MKRELLLIVFLLNFYNYTLHAQPLSTKQIVDVELEIKAFMSAIAEYSNCHGVGTSQKLATIVGLHDSFDGTDLMFNDLANLESNGDTSENYNWGEYLTNIQVDFSNEIYVEPPKNISVLNCVVKNKNNVYVYASAEKTLTYKSQTKIYTILISVNISNNNNYAIKEVVSPRFFKNENGTCDIGIDKTDVANQVLPLRAKADDYFLKKDYMSAKNTLLAISKMVPNDLTIKMKIQDCDKLYFARGKTVNC